MWKHSRKLLVGKIKFSSLGRVKFSTEHSIQKESLGGVELFVENLSRAETFLRRKKRVGCRMQTGVETAVAAVATLTQVGT